MTSKTSLLSADFVLEWHFQMLWRQLNTTHSKLNSHLKKNPHQSCHKCQIQLSVTKDLDFHLFLTLKHTTSEGLDYSLCSTQPATCELMKRSIELSLYKSICSINMNICLLIIITQTGLSFMRETKMLKINSTISSEESNQAQTK